MEFLKRIKVNALLLKGAPSSLLEGIKGINSFRHFFNGIIAKNIPVFCDRRIDHLGGKVHSEVTQPIFKEPPVVIPLKEFGYGNELYFSLSGNLATPNVTPSHIPGHRAYTPEIYWVKDGKEMPYYIGYPQLPVGVREALPGTNPYRSTEKDDRMVLNNGVEISLGKGHCAVNKGRSAGFFLRNVDRIIIDWSEGRQSLLVEFFDDQNGRWEQGVFDLSIERLQLQLLKHLEYVNGTLEVKRDVGIYRYQFPPKEWVGKEVIVTTQNGEVIKGSNLQFNPIDAQNSIMLTVDGRMKTFGYEMREIRLAANHDRAMFSDPLGGIDLTPANMNLQTQNAGEGIKFHLDHVMFQQLQNAPGFVPVIINIQPLKNLQTILGA